MNLRRAVASLIAAALVLGLAACGGSSDQAMKLLRQTFSGRHRVSSGQLAMLLSVGPSPGTASGAKGPIVLSVAGPFQDLGPGRLPASVFNVSLTAIGTTAAVTITSTGSSGYVTFQGQSYQLPPATYQRLESTFAELGSAPGGGSSGTLSRLGIHPQRWLVNPQIAGDEGINGINTTHIRAGIDMTALLADLNRFLTRAAAAGVSANSGIPLGISAASRRRIASEVKNPTVNLWTGVADKTLRRLEVDLTVPVSGQLSLLLGRSAAIGLTMDYANLNQPQLITAPKKLYPYSQFQAKLRVLITDLEGGLVSGGSTGSSSGTATTGSGPNYQAYTNCINAAAGNISKIQQCAPLLGGQ